MSHFPTAYLPQNIPKAAADFMHTILSLHEIQILFSKFCVPVSPADRRHKTTCLLNCQLSEMFLSDFVCSKNGYLCSVCCSLFYIDPVLLLTQTTCFGISFVAFEQLYISNLLIEFL